MNRKTFSLLAGALALCSGAAGCGGSGPPASTGSTTTSSGGTGTTSTSGITLGTGGGTGGTGGTSTGGGGTGGTGGTGGMDGGTMDSGMDSGTMDSGMMDSGMMDSSMPDSGMDSGEMDSGADTGTDAGTCTTPADCPVTGNECITATCNAGVCGTAFVQAGTATPTQTPGDCQVTRCDGSGNITSVADNNDLPANTNPCTTAACNGGVPSNPPAPAETSCGAGMVCDGTGNCVGCVAAADCPGPDTDCQTRACNGGTCGFSFKAAGTVTSTQTPGDCHTNQCDGSGNVMSVVDNNDLPANTNPCTSAACTAGVPSNPPLPANTPCGGSLVCDGNGVCVGCVTGADCPGTDTECQTRTCSGGMCGFSYTASGTVTTAQTPGDCHTNQCDGMGNIVAVVDDNDLPANPSACTTAVCTAGVPSNPPLPSRTTCAQGGGTLCDGMGTCVQCLLPTDCPGTDTECQTRTCAAGACGEDDAMAGTATSAQTPGDCHTNECDGMGNIVSVVDDSDTPSSSTCATGSCTAGVPSSIPVASGTACTDGGGVACDGAGACSHAVVVVRSGDGSAALSSAATAAFLEERFVTTGALVPRGALNPLAMPTMASGSNARLTLSGTATSEGALALSADGHYLTLAGYDAATGTASVNTSTSSTVNRIVGRVDAAFDVDTTTKINALISGSNPRSAVTDDGTRFWVGGAANGVVAIPFGTTGGTAIISGSPTNVRVVDIFGGQLYGSSGSGTFVNVFTVGSGLPTTAGQTATSLTGMPTTGASPYAYVFFDLDASIPGFDRLYVADDRGTPNGGVQRWNYNATTSQWVLSATLNQVSSGGNPVFTAFRGVTGYVSSGTTVTLIATGADATSANALAVFVDDGTTTPTGTKLTAAPTNTAFRGIALLPQ